MKIVLISMPDSGAFSRGLKMHRVIISGQWKRAIRRNYEFLSELEADASYCQILTPYPKTKLREYLIGEGLVTNHDRYERYSGFWAIVKTRHLESDQLEYAFWYHRQTALGWWKPAVFPCKQGKILTSLWMYMV